ncbi:MAG: hypothetical protein ACOH2V_00100 [Candidatus Saccharimonadaceae bacterium]
MYQFTTTNVINSQYALDYAGNILTDANGVDIPKYKGSATQLVFAKIGTFKKAGIVSLSKRAFTAGVKEIAKVTVTTVPAGKVARLTVELKLSGATNSDYVNYTLDFSKPITVEVIASGTPATDATALVTQLNALKNRFGQNYFLASATGAEITLTAKESVQRFKAITLGQETDNLNSLTQVDYVTVASGAVTTPGAMGFGDDAWMIRTVYVPTAENVRYFGISRDERPILGGQYSEYVLRYAIEKNGTDGILAGGKSITTHVFYVLATLVATFEAALANVGVSIDTVGTGVTAITVGTNLVGIGSALVTPKQLGITSTTPAGVTGGTWALTGVNTVAGTLNLAKVSLTGSGLFSLSVGHGLATGDILGVSVTIDGVTQTANLTFAV